MELSALARTRKSMVKITVMLLLISLVGLQFAKVAEANPIPWCFNPAMTITIQSPENGANSALPVFVSFTSQGDHQFSVSDDSTQSWVRSFFYVLDGQDMRTSGMRFAGTKTTAIYSQGSVYGYNFNGQAHLTNLTEGLHSITVYYGAVNNISYVGSRDEKIYYNPAWQATSQFYVDSKLTPSPTPTFTPTPSLNPSPAPTPTSTPSPRETSTPIPANTSTPLANVVSTWGNNIVLYFIGGAAIALVDLSILFLSKRRE
jgi:hypothetical protein